MRILLLIAVMASINLNAQKKTRFTFADKTFKIGAIHKVDPNFDFNYEEIIGESTSLYTSNQETFDRIIKFLEAYPGLSIEVGCHTDSRGSDKANLDLSQNQADQIVDALIQNGISEERLIAKGYGESELAVPAEKTDALKGDAKENAHKMNRRTELKIIEIKEL